MNILFVCSVYHPVTGGAQDPIDQLGAELVTRGHRVDVLTRHVPPTTPTREVRNGVRVHRVPNTVLPSDFRALSDELREFVREVHRPDVIHVVGLRRPLPLVAELLARLWGVPVIQTVGGYDIPDVVDPDPRLVWLTGRDLVLPAMRRADLLNAASDDLARQTELLLGDRAPVPTLYVGIDHGLFADAEPHRDASAWGPYVLSLRRLEPAKSVDRTIEALDHLRDEIPELCLVVAGDGSERAALEEYTERLGLSSRVHFVGEVPLEEAASLLRSAFATVVASKSEGGGLVNIEAQAAGCPVIATRAGGIGEYLGGESGAMYVDAPDGALIADALRALWNGPEARARLVEDARLLSERLSTRTLAVEYAELYAELAAGHRAREFVPWEAIGAALWEDLALPEGRAPTLDAPWRAPLAVEELVLSTADKEFRALGPGAERFYYLAWSSGVSTERLGEVCAYVLRATRELPGETVAAGLEHAADWGRFDIESCLSYVRD
ncbi:glycosyltransferase family 4 protein [Streptomyces sedi]|uniref:Glycosyltransferase n=1 Tax=Streptomyces sedi TaxID=555059 RepID=A0A5C4VEG9_9ACTN|nr:glycosyltransferase [Streptomyces sedi]TNM34293.1 glycosyltransferase [Streptomyces sedi]